ncbi:MarR family winged helix-turn-helix transcriptional regulator [Nocardioides sp.]|uniref:MarR family winged helix-turn-helix transcriptional regulator n=1 Tax=Nocardioides sp. TaxID=35761 RepID=UPI003527308C
MSQRDDLMGGLEGEFGVLLHRLRRVVADRARAVHPDLTGASYLLLGHLLEHGPMRSSCLVETFGVDKGAVSRQVRQLLDLGLVERRPDPEDGRAQLVAVSESAREALVEVSGQRRKLLADRLSDWTEDDLRGFVSVLGRYNAALAD